MKSIKIKEKKIKEDIINELDIPDVLDKVRPLAIDKVMELEEEKQTVRLNFHRPAKIFATCFASVIAVVLIVVLGFNLTSNKSSRMYEADYANSADASESIPNESSYGKPNSKDEKISTEDLDSFKAEYFESITENKLSDEALETYYNEISSYISQGKTLEEVIDIYSTNEELDDDSITFIYNSLNK